MRSIVEKMDCLPDGNPYLLYGNKSEGGVLEVINADYIPTQEGVAKAVHTLVTVGGWNHVYVFHVEADASSPSWSFVNEDSSYGGGVLRGYSERTEDLTQGP